MESTSLAKQHLHGHALKKRLLKGIDRLLPMPQVVLKAQNLLIDPNSSFVEISQSSHQSHQTSSQFKSGPRR